MPGIGRDSLVGDPAAVEAERDPGGQVDAGDGFGGEVLGGEEDQVAWLPPPRVLTRVSRPAITRAQARPPVLLRILRSTSSRLPAEAPAVG